MSKNTKIGIILPDSDLMDKGYLNPFPEALSNYRPEIESGKGIVFLEEFVVHDGPLEEKIFKGFLKRKENERRNGSTRD